jgi:hypothetical protein
MHYLGESYSCDSTMDYGKHDSILVSSPDPRSPHTAFQHSALFSIVHLTLEVRILQEGMSTGHESQFFLDCISTPEMLLGSSYTCSFIW